MTVELEMRIETAVKLMAEVHGRKLPPAAIQRWVRKLKPVSDRSAFWAVLERACDAKFMPAVPEILEQVYHESKARTESTVVVRPLTERERERADVAAIKAMLWLHYEKRWSLTDFAGHALGRLFGQPVEPALRAAMLMPGYDKQSILTWMQDEIARGN